MSAGRNTKTGRALAVFIARKALLTGGIIAAAILLLLVFGIWLLASNISAWWWILMLPIGLAALITFIVYSFVRFILLKIWPHQFTKEQKKALQAFLDKITGLNDARSVPMPLYVLKTLWELARYRDARTIRQTIESSKSLKSDFSRLSDFFNE